MNLDTRARRAADGVRASTQGVDPMGQVTELKHADKARRRNGTALGGLIALLVIAGVAWFATSSLGGGNDALPAGQDPSPSTNEVATPFTYQPGTEVGTKLNPPLVTNAPKGWDIPADESYVWLGNGIGLGPHIEISGPMLGVYDQETGKSVKVPDSRCTPGVSGPYCSGYAAWLREHPSFTVIATQVVTIDGEQFPQLTLRANDDAAPAAGYDGVLLGSFKGSGTDQSWDQVNAGETFTETVLVFGNKTMVVKASGAQTPGQQTELDAALAGVLNSMTLPG